MPAEQSVSELAAQLAQAQARITELEAAASGLASAPLPGPHFLLESITDAFVALDQQFRFVWVNRETERLTGFTSAELLHYSVWELFPATIGSEFEVQCRKAIAENTPQEFDYYFPPQKRWYHNKAYPTGDGGLAIYWRDVTHQKTMEAELRRQALVLSQVHNSVIISDLQGVITSWNRGAEELFGYSAAEVIGRHIELLCLEDDREQLRSDLLEPLRRAAKLEVELRNVRKSGEVCRVRYLLSLLTDEADQPYAILAIVLDMTARREMEDALRESEERYRCLTNAMPQVAFLSDATGTTSLLNRQWQEFAGGSAGAHQELKWPAWVHPDDLPAFMASWSECMRTGTPFEAEYRLRNAGGEYCWHLARAVPVRGADELITQWVGTSTDINALKCAEEALRKSEERFRLASKALGGIVYDWTPQTGAVERNGDLRKLLGVSIEEAPPLEQWWQERVHPQDAAKSGSNLLRRLGKNATSFETEFRMRHADGRWIHVCDRGYIVRSPDGTPVRVVGSSQDITPRKRLEQEVHGSNALLRFQAAILATTNDAVVAIDPNRVITYLSPGAERLYGITSADAVGRPLSQVHQYTWLHPEDERRAWADLADLGSWKGEYIHIKKDGSQLVVSSTVNMLPPEFGGGMVAVIRDVSEKKRAEVESRKQAAELARANEDLLHFAYAISHDLQAPLRTVISFSQLLALKYKGKLDDQGTDFLRLIVEAGGRMAEMIRGLLDLATVAGVESQFPNRVALETPLQTALDNLGSEVGSTGAAIVYDSLPEVEGDAGQLTQLFQNLVGNALKYRRGGVTPTIRITAERGHQEWIIRLEDNGIGFEASQAERIFGVFKRLHGSEYAGTGVGLAICKRIVERRGGRIWATGTPGQGATFSFSIPDDAIESSLRTAPSVQTSTDFAANPPEIPSAYEELFQTLDLAHAMVRDMEGKILIWTKGAERLYQWSKKDAVGNHLHQMLRTEFPKPWQEIELELYNSGQWEGQLKKFRQDGSPIWLASQWSLYRDANGRGQSVIEVDTDISDLKVPV